MIADKNINELEKLVKEAYQNYPAYKLFMAGAGMAHWIEHENIDQINAGASMINSVYKLLGIIEPEEIEDKV